MNIGNEFKENKLYKGIKYHDKVPLLAKDLNEATDTLANKNKYLLDNILGNGIINDFSPTIYPLSAGATGIKLDTPILLNLEGDIVSIMHKKKGADYFLIPDTAPDVGTLAILGYYTEITWESTLHEYGGFSNDELHNTLLDNEFSVSVTSRYQFVWDVICAGSLSVGDTLSQKINSETVSSTIQEKLDNVFLAEATNNKIVDNRVYIIPILTYIKGNNGVTNITPVHRNTAGVGILTSSSTPEGTYPEGTRWYNPISQTFKSYISGIGFVDETAHVGFIHYQFMNTAEAEISNPTDITIVLDFPTMLEADFIRVTYEGLELIKEEEYTIDYGAKTITLLGFTRHVGEKLIVILDRLIGATDASSVPTLTATITDHLSSTGSSSNAGHLKLSNEIVPTLGIANGVAATPKSVYDSKIMTDESNQKKYRFGVNAGLLYIEEI